MTASDEFKDPVLRDFFVTKDGLIFSVSDYFHPQKGIRSVLRYIPDENGDRIRKKGGGRYRKAEFGESFEFLKTHHPDWLSDVAVVPRQDIAEILKPADVVADILSGARPFPAVEELIRRLEKDGVSVSAMGISGSVLPGLDNEESDVDFLVCGPNWFKAKKSLADMKQKDDPSFCYTISELDHDMWQTVYKKRKSPLSFEDFFAHEIRKGNRGMFISKNGGKDVFFDLLFVRSSDQIKETEPIRRGIDTEKKEITAVITKAPYAFDNPAIYLIDHDEIDEIYSYTHTYAGQALPGETVQARGMVEVIGARKRLVIGTSREARDEWMISITLLGEPKTKE
ncbi:MAG: DNA polymerase subunit beta [Methanimicrococcus sp.]|nr:DNA polymerase subunit beta [Methanimicrococcus sp.]